MPTQNPYEQLSFSKYIENTPPQPTTPKTISSKKLKLAKSKPEIPEILKNCDYSSLKAFFNSLGKEGIYYTYSTYNVSLKKNVEMINYYDISDELITNYVDRLLIPPKDKYVNYSSFYGKNISFPIVYFGDDGTMWSSNVSIQLNDTFNYHYYKSSRTIVKKFSASKWKPTNKLLHKACFLQTEEQLEKIVKQNNEYAYNFCKNYSCEFASILMAPHLEVLHKAGYTFAKSFFKVRKFPPYREDLKTEFDCFNRLCKTGKNPKEILKTSRAVYTTLKQESNIKIWDSMRKLDKFGRLNQDTIQQAYDMDFTADDLSKMNEVLNKTYEGKPVFTFPTLVTYLNRLDMYEAIDRKEALMLLKDYLTMCNQLHQKPKIDGDSLKREHDVTARTVRQKRDEIMAEQIQSGCDKQQIYNYQEAVYFIRGIQSYDDLINEATQQHNCVASYAGSIKSGRSMIYVMREVANPDKSLITVELSPSQKTIRQKFLAYNRPIHNKSQSEFLERWLKHVKAVEAGITPSQELTFMQKSQQPILPNEIPSTGFTQTI